ncbi:MAG TPA: sodium:solute symporter family protein [Candidatus Methanofastidiosa archaeon]|nr:sodium:solute symporter family protein [Candidatus Methanofastidiosa archaeon]
MADFYRVFIVMVYFVVLMGIGTWASRKIKTSTDYMLAGKNLGFWVFVFLIVASTTSGMTLLGSSGLGYVTGWPTIWEQIFVPLTVAFCIIFYGAKMAKIGRKRGYLTVQDYFADRFYSPRGIRGIAGISVITTSIIYLVGQYTAISIVLVWIFNITHTQALLIAGTIVFIYVLLGGLYAVAWTNTIQGLAIIIGVVILAPLIIKEAGGMTFINGVLASIDPEMITLSYPEAYASYAFATPMYLVSFFFLLAIGLGSSPHIINNVLAVRKQKYFKYAPVAAFGIYVVVMYLIKMVGFSARAMVETGAMTVPYADYSFVAAVEHVLPDAVWPIFMVVVLAAVMSTTDRIMLTIGNTASWDIYKNIINPDADDKKVTLYTRIVVFAVAVITIVLAINPPSLLAWLIWMTIGITLSVFVVPLVAGLYWKRATREGAMAAMISGFVSAVVFGYIYKYVEVLPMHFSMYSFIVSVVAMIVVSLVTKPPPAEVIERTFTGPFISIKEDK